MSAAVNDLRASLLESEGGRKSAGGGGRRMIFETASTAMRRRIGRRAIRNGSDPAACDPRGQNPRGHDQQGFTLQTLIVTSVVVFVAIAVGFTLFAINAGSSEDLEDARLWLALVYGWFVYGWLSSTTSLSTACSFMVGTRLRLVCLRLAFIHGLFDCGLRLSTVCGPKWPRRGC